MNLVSLDPELSLNTIDTHRHNSNLFQPSLNFSPSYLVQACGRGCITAFNQTPSCLQLNAITFYQIKPIPTISQFLTFLPSPGLWQRLHHRLQSNAIMPTIKRHHLLPNQASLSHTMGPSLGS